MRLNMKLTDGCKAWWGATTYSTVVGISRDGDACRSSPDLEGDNRYPTARDLSGGGRIPMSHVPGSSWPLPGTKVGQVSLRPVRQKRT